MVKLFMKECVWHPLCCQWTTYQCPPCLICVISFSSQSKLYFTFHSCLSCCLHLLYFPICVSLSLTPFVFTLDLLPCDFLSPAYNTRYLFHRTLFSFLLLFSTYIIYFTQVMQKGRRIWANKLLKLLVCAFIPPKPKNSTKWLTLSGTS